jgi:hypothetical protein
LPDWNIKKRENGLFPLRPGAKLVTRDGHAFSLATGWIENPAGEFRKQDCERAAFIRLAAKLKKQYPRLPVCILAGGLYPCENAFKICGDYGWKFISVLQDASLKTVREELTLTRLRQSQVRYRTTEHGWHIAREYRYQRDVEYHKKYTLNRVQCIETRNNRNKKKENTRPPPRETARSGM